jgi:cell cycle checkpoint protein
MSRASDMRPLSAASSSMSKISRRQVILLEDLPNLLHGPTLETFQSAIAQHIKTSDTPIVLIVSDAGSRGQFKDEEGWSNRQTSVVDVRMILPTPLLHDSATLQVE